MPRSTATTLGTAAVAGLVLLLGACGGDDDDTASDDGPSGTAAAAEGGALTVVAEDIGFDADSYEAPAGTVEVVYEQGGSIVHTLLIEGVDDFELEVSGGDDVDRGTVELEAGEYVIYCDVPGHRSAGMEAELTVS